jgi:hypothetical protein
MGFENEARKMLKDFNVKKEADKALAEFKKKYTKRQMSELEELTFKIAFTTGANRILDEATKDMKALYTDMNEKARK